MKNAILSFVVTLLLLTAFGTLAGVGDKETLTGSYIWNSGQPSDLKAIFTATGENDWDVAFHFRFRGRAEVFSGTASGNLSDGNLKGQVKNKNGHGSRTFTFSGKFENGTFRGKHAEIFGKRESSTGTLTLKRDGSRGSTVI